MVTETQPNHSWFSMKRGWSLCVKKCFKTNVIDLECWHIQLYNSIQLNRINFWSEKKWYLQKIRPEHWYVRAKKQKNCQKCLSKRKVINKIGWLSTWGLIKQLLKQKTILITVGRNASTVVWIASVPSYLAHQISIARTDIFNFFKIGLLTQ